MHIFFLHLWNFDVQTIDICRNTSDQISVNLTDVPCPFVTVLSVLSMNDVTSRKLVVYRLSHVNVLARCMQYKLDAQKKSLSIQCLRYAIGQVVQILYELLQCMKYMKPKEDLQNRNLRPHLKTTKVVSKIFEFVQRFLRNLMEVLVFIPLFHICLHER